MWHVVVMLGLIFWMYDGYAWLTNAVPARGGRRQLLLLAAMAGYLVLAIAIPDAFTGTGLTFGIAYLVIVVVHAFLYVSQAGESSAAAMRALAPNNLAAAAAIVVAGAIGGTAQEVVWTAVFLLLWFATTAGGFEIGVAHFVERHGLLVIVAIGESVVATGFAARHLPVDLELVVVAVLGLALSAGLWWTYFGDGEERIEQAFGAATGPARVRIALQGFGYAHYVMLLAVVLTAVGLKTAVADPGAELSPAHALVLTGGASLFLAGDGWFRSVLGVRPPPASRAVTAGVVLVAVPAGTAVSAAVGLAVTAALLVAGLAFERRAALDLEAGN
jgi:low temperature requirement protein LtrA